MLVCIVYHAALGLFLFGVDLMELNRLYHMDCMEGMKNFPDGYFELAVVDPPHGVGADKGRRAVWSPSSKSRQVGIQNFMMKHGRKSPFKPRVIEYEKKTWDKIPEPEYFVELFRVSQRQIVFGGNNFPLPLTAGWIAWDKKQTMPSLSKCELV